MSDQWVDLRAMGGLFETTARVHRPGTQESRVEQQDMSRLPECAWPLHAHYDMPGGAYLFTPSLSVRRGEASEQRASAFFRRVSHASYEQLGVKTLLLRGIANRRGKVRYTRAAQPEPRWGRLGPPGGAIMDRSELLERLARKEPFSRTYLDNGEYAGIRIGSADMSGCSLVGANLSDAVFEDVTLEAVFADKVHAERSSFTRCRMSRTRFKKAALEQARFSDCKLVQAGFDTATLNRARFFGGEFRQVNLTEANLEGAEFRNLVLDDCALTDNRGRGCVFVECRFQGSAIYDPDFAGARFEKVTFEDTVFSAGTAAGAAFVACDLRGMRFSDASDAGGDDVPDFSGATYDAATRFPEGFDPDAHGMKPWPEL